MAERAWPATVIVDLDGPILDGRERHYACYTRILGELGLARLPIEEYWELKRDPASPTPLAAGGAAGVAEAYEERWLEVIEAGWALELDALQPGALDVLTGWRRRGMRLVVATQRRDAEATLRQLERLGVAALVDHVVVCGDDDKAARVQDEVADLVPTATVWIGDTEMDVEAAQALGCPAWVVTCGLRSEAYLRSLGPDRVFPDLRSVGL